MNIDSPIFVPQCNGTNKTSNIIDIPKTPPLVGNLLPWSRLASSMPTAAMHYYHQQQMHHQQQQQRQQQMQHIYQHQRNFFNANFNQFGQWSPPPPLSMGPLTLAQHVKQQQKAHAAIKRQQQQQQQQQQKTRNIAQKQQAQQKQKNAACIQLNSSNKSNDNSNMNMNSSNSDKTENSSDGQPNVVDIVDGTEDSGKLSPTLLDSEATAPTTTTKKNDTMQLNGSRASHNLKQQQQHIPHHHQHHNNPHHQHHHQQQQQHQHLHMQHKHDSSDSGLSTIAPGPARHHQHPQHQQHQQQQQSAKQRKIRSSNNKRTDVATSSSTVASTAVKQRGVTDFALNEWLEHGEMGYRYERHFMSSRVEDNILPRHNAVHRNSTSSEAAVSDDLNSSSSNDDLNLSIISKTSKKSSKSRQKRQQKRKAQDTHKIITPEPMDIDEDVKENQRPPNHNNHASSNAPTQKHNTANLRKQCTKAAALKAANKQTTPHNSNNNHHNHNHINANSSGTSNPHSNSRKPNITNTLSNSSSTSSVCSTLSSASSSTSLSCSSLPSSSSSSPTNSAHSSPTASPTVSKRNAEHYKKIARNFVPPQRMRNKPHMSESELVDYLRRYVIDPNLLRVYGYPVESAHHEGCIEIYRCLPRTYNTSTEISSKSGIINMQDGLKVSYSSTTIQQWTLSDNSNDSTDSGQASGESSPPSVDSDASETGEDETAATTACYTPDGTYQIFSQYKQSLEKQCARCNRAFHVTETGEYLTRESCVFHWGKMLRVFNGRGYVGQYTCCNGEEDSEGCSRNSLHVWTGAVLGLNGPYGDFVHTRSRTHDRRRAPKVYALDCEMSYTGRGLEATKVTMVGYDGQLVYEHFVRPEAEIVDYNTRFSGITEKDLSTHSNTTVKTLPEVQRDLLQLIDADTILIGHALDNDLRVLRLVHKTVVDTSIAFPHANGFPYRRSLKTLARTHLQRDIQCSEAGHSSLEDSRTSLDLMIWKVHMDKRN